MDYSIIFVCLMGMGTVFFGLICLIVLTTLLGRICGRKQQAAPAAAISAPAAAPAIRRTRSFPKAPPRTEHKNPRNEKR